MSWTSHLIDAAKSLDAWTGRPLARWLGGPRRPLPDTPRRVLVVRLWGLGNLTLLAPQLGANADRELTLLTLARNAPFARRHLPGVRLVGVPLPGAPGFLRAVVRLARELRRRPPDLIVDAEAFLRLPALLARTASGAPCVGLDTPGQGRRPLLDRPLAHDPTRHVALTYRALFAAAGLATARAPGGLDRDPSRAVALAARLGLDDRPRVVLHPGSGDHFPGRRWPAERYARLAAHLAADGRRQVLLTGARDEAGLVARVAALAGPGVRDLTGRLDADELADLLADAALLVTNDTGPLHVADALGTAAVALYGPNTPHRYGPRRPGSLALFADLPCSPCLDDRTMKRSSCRRHDCMTALAVDDVLAACRRVLEGAPREVPHALPA